ncbi:MAG: FAD:protein FMN transferase [Maribacter sp.]
MRLMHNSEVLRICNMALTLVLAVATFYACKEDAPKIIQNANSGGALGTSYHLIYQSETQLDFQKEIDSVFEVVNRSLSTYLPDSDISKINEGDSTIVVDIMFKEVFELSKEIHGKTKGFFDPTVGVLVNAWGFGPGNRLQMDSTVVDSLMQYVGFEKVTLTDTRTIQKSDPQLRFDFNAIAKGYAIDRLAVLMDEKGIENYLLEVGGEVVAKGENKIKKKPWTAGIEDPQAEAGRRLKRAIHLKDRALASSGNYRKFRIDSLTGKKYVHTINPKTGFTQNSSTLGTNVLAKTCAEADAYATAFMAMDLDEVIDLLETEKELDAYIVYLNEAGESKEYMTEGFRKLILD